MFSRLLNRRSGSVDEIENTSPSKSSVTLDDSAIGPSVSIKLSSSPKKRNHSSTNSEIEESKRQNVNDSFLVELENVPSDLESSAPVNENIDDTPLVSDSKNQVSSSDSSLHDQLAIPFDENTPFWVPILLRSFDSLKNDIQENVLTLSEEVKSINVKFDNFCNEASKRLSLLENKSLSTDTKISVLEEKVQSVVQNCNVFNEKIDVFTTKSVNVSSSLKSEIVATNEKLLDLEKNAQFTSDFFDSMKNQIELLSSSNANLLKSVDILATQLDANEQHNRNECLLLHGVPEEEKETPSKSSNLFVSHVNQHLNAGMTVEHIRRAHRLGQKRKNGKPRPIIARIWNSELRNYLYYKKREFKNSNISLTENLTKKRMSIKIEAEGKYGSSNVWSKEGRIYAKDNNNVIIPIIL